MWQFDCCAPFLTFYQEVNQKAMLIIISLPAIADTLVPMWALGLSFGFSRFIGLVFGLAAASKAARMQPTDVLRYE